MYGAGSWEPRYDLHLTDDSVLVNANAVVNNRGKEELKNVRLKLVAGLPLAMQPVYAKQHPRFSNDMLRLLLRNTWISWRISCSCIR